jgi:mono/diheme cytochrome c family protein
MFGGASPRNRRPVIVAAAALAALAGCASSPAREEGGSVGRGRDYASLHCSSCHAVDLDGPSPYAGAPPFRTLRGRWDGPSVQLRLARSPVHNRPDMPPRDLTREQAADISALIRDLRDQSAMKPRFCIPLTWC